MEIIYKRNEEVSNYAYCDMIFKNKKALNGFNKMLEQVEFEHVAGEEFNVQNVFFENPIQGTLYLCYPLNVVVKEKIEFDSLYSLISEIRRTYRQIYEEEATKRKYGIWGHGIYDLVIEAIKIYEDNLIDVSIGS